VCAYVRVGVCAYVRVDVCAVVYVRVGVCAVVYVRVVVFAVVCGMFPRSVFTCFTVYLIYCYMYDVIV